MKERILFWLFLILIPLFPFVWFALGGIDPESQLVDVTQIPRQWLLSIFSIAAVLLFWKDLKAKTFGFSIPQVLWISFFIISAISPFYAANSSEAWSIVSKYGLYTSFIILLPNLLKYIKDWAQIIKPLIVFSIIAALSALLDIFAAPEGLAFWKNIYQVKGSFSHKNILSIVLFLSLPISFLGQLFLKSNWKSTSTILMFLLLIEIFLLRTRGVWLSVFVASSIVLIINKTSVKSEAYIKLPKKPILISTAIIAILLVGLMVIPQVKESVLDGSNVSRRTAFWENSVEMIKEHPVKGVGSGNWRINFPKYGLEKLDVSVQQGEVQIQRPHNDFIWALSENGIIGGLLFFSFFISLFLVVINSARASEGRELKISLIVLFALSGYFSFSLADFPLERPEVIFIFILLISLILKDVKPKISLSAIPSLGVILILSGFSLFVSQIEWGSEKNMVDVLTANAQRNAQKIIPAVERAKSNYYQIDNFSNPLDYFSSIGYLVTKRNAEAEKSIEKALSQNPYSLISLGQKANILSSQNKKKEALDVYKEALEISPRYEVALLNSAEIHLQENDYLSAMPYLMAVPKTSKNPKYPKMVGFALAKLVQDYKKDKKYVLLAEYLINSGGRKQEEFYRAYIQLLNSGKQL